jgi:hypothetical protein
MQIIKDHATKDTSSRLQHANFNFAIIGEAIGNEPGIGNIRASAFHDDGSQYVLRVYQTQVARPDLKVRG